MPRSKEQTRVLSLLLGLGLALSALLFWRQKQVDGFQLGIQAGTLGSTPIILNADGLLVESNLKNLSDIFSKYNFSDSKKKIRIIDEAAKAVVWETGMATSDDSDIKRYVILNPESESGDIVDASRQSQPGVSFVGLIKKETETSYINALSGSGIVEYNGFRAKVDTTKLYPTIGTYTAAGSILYDPIAKKEIWKSGQTGTLTPEGTKELILYSTKEKKYAKLTEIDTLLNSDTNKQNTDMQLIYPVIKMGTSDEYIDARTVKYESVKFTPLSSSSNLYMYAGIGIGVVAGAALLFVAIRTFTKSSNTGNATASNSK